MKDIFNEQAVVQSIGAEVLAADKAGAVIDLDGFEGAEVDIAVGVGGITFSSTNKIEFLLEHSDNGTDYTAVALADVQNVASVGTGGIVKSLVAAHATADVTRIGYIGGKRYIRPTADFSGTHGTGTPIAVVVVKGRPRATVSV
jgi:hypothetical protein